MKIKGLASA